MSTDRITKVTLQAQVAQYLDGMDKAAKKTREVGTEAEKLGQKKEAFELLGKTSLVMGAAIAAGVGLAIAKYAEFDQAMSNVSAATIDTSESATDAAARMKALGDAAIEAGASTVFSASESANAIEELAKAGLSTADILSGALAGSLDLASAGELGVARAAEIASTTLQQFKLDGGQASHVADVLAAGAGKAMGSVEDLANGLKFVGPVANAMNISLEETTGTLALFAQQGIIGEQAGTSLRGVLSSLTSPSSQARSEIDRLGISLYDSNGKFLGMKNAAGELSKAYLTMDDEARNASLGIIFGRETITAATTLYQAGAKGVAEWTDAVDDTGFAALVAKGRLDNLKGDVEQLGGAFDTALIQTGSAGNDVLRGMTQALTNVVDLYNDAEEPVKVAALGIGAVAGAALLAGGAFFVGAPKAAAFNAAIATMGPNAQKAGSMLTAAAGPIGLAFAIAGVALAVFAGEQANAKARTEAFSDTLEAQTGMITKSTRELVKTNLSAKESFLWMESQSAFDAAKKLGLGIDVVTDAALGNADALKEVEKATSGSTVASREAVKVREKLGITEAEYLAATKKVRDGVKGQSDSLEEAIRVTKQKESADEEAAAKAEEHAGALDTLKGKSNDTKDSIQELADQIRGFGSATLSTRDANRNLEAAYDSLTASVKENGATLDITEEKGRANESALDAIAKAALQSAAANYEQTGSQEAANAVIATGREELIKSLEQFGITDQAAQDYADSLGLIPGNISTAVDLSKDQAQLDLDAWLAATNARTATVRVVPQFDSIAKSTLGGMTQANGAVVDFYANGGMRENHVAQIAPAGAWRVWAEDETGGEAYIPLSPAKRARSLEIWAETGSRLGVAGFANGFLSPNYAPVQYAPAGPSGASSGGGSRSVSSTVQVTAYTNDPHEVANAVQAKQNWELRNF